jgi:hypothetical protein
MPGVVNIERAFRARQLRNGISSVDHMYRVTEPVEMFELNLRFIVRRGRKMRIAARPRRGREEEQEPNRTKVECPMSNDCKFSEAPLGDLHSSNAMSFHDYRPGDCMAMLYKQPCGDNLPEATTILLRQMGSETETEPSDFDIYDAGPTSGIRSGSFRRLLLEPVE